MLCSIFQKLRNPRHSGCSIPTTKSNDEQNMFLKRPKTFLENETWTGPGKMKPGPEVKTWTVFFFKLRPDRTGKTKTRTRRKNPDRKKWNPDQRWKPGPIFCFKPGPVRTGPDRENLNPDQRGKPVPRKIKTRTRNRTDWNIPELMTLCGTCMLADQPCRKC